jgi:hypothetical protein
METAVKDTPGDLVTSLLVKFFHALARPQDFLLPPDVETELQTAKARASRKPIRRERHVPQMKVTWPEPKPSTKFWPRARSRLRKRP